MKTKELKSKNILKDSLKTLYDRSIYLLLFQLIYKALILIIFKSLQTVIVSLFVRAKEYDLVIHEQVPRVLINFAGVFLTAAAIILFVMLTYYESTLILMVLNKEKDGARINLSDLNKGARGKLREMIGGKKLGLALYTLLLIPPLNIGILLSIFPALSIPNFLRTQMEKFPASTILFILLGISLIYLYIKLFIVLPIITFNDKTFKEAAQISFKNIKDKSFKFILTLTIGVLTWLIISRLPYLISGDLKFRLPRILKSLSNSLVTIFTLLISPLILAVSLEMFKSSSELADLKEEKKEEKVERGKLRTIVLKISQRLLSSIERIIIRLGRYKKTLILITIAVIVGLNLYDAQGARPLEDKQLVIGHRGGEYGVENTIETIVFAGKEGSDYVEMDVLLTKDNIPVVIHDNNLKRLAETSEKISDLEINEVEAMTIESETKEDDIPTLEDLAKAAKGKTKLLLEFKLHGKEKESVVDKTIEILEEEGILEDTIFQTAEYEIVEEFNEKYDKLYMGYIYKSKKKSVSIDKALKTPVDFISAKGSTVDKKMIKKVHKAKKPIYAWTINKVPEAERLLDLGIDGIITDYPLEMIELIDRYNK